MSVRSDAPARVESAAEGDLDALVALERLCASHPWTRAHFAAALAQPTTRVFVARADDGAPAALCVVAHAADEVEVHDVAVHPAARRRGLGRRLLEHALGAAARAGARTAFLEVRAANAAARALYAALGFVCVGERPGYYRDPDENAVIMRLDLRNLEFSGGAC